MRIKVKLTESSKEIDIREWFKNHKILRAIVCVLLMFPLVKGLLMLRSII